MLSGEPPMAGHRAVRREMQKIRRRQKAIKYIALVSVAHFAMDRRTQVAVIVAVVGLAAAASLAAEGGNPLQWYLDRGRGDRSRSKGHG